MPTVELVEHVPDLLLPYIDRWTVQEPELLDLQIMALMQAQMDAGHAWLLRHGGTYVFLRRQTPWIGNVHLYNTGSTWNMVRAFKAITHAALEGFVRLEARTHDKRNGSVMIRCGWKQDAVFRGGFHTRDGQYVDEYGYGVTRWDQ